MTAIDSNVRQYLKKLTVNLQRSQQRVKELEDKGHEPIAIVAMSCRYPGGVRTPEELWTLVRDGGDAISAFPEDRGWKLDERHEGGFLEDADQFDPAFFGISPRETLAIDPQQRLLLETSWETLENAGIDPASLQGAPCGVFVGVFDSGYITQRQAAGLEDVAELEELRGYVGTGNTTSVASGRIAYTLGLQGPAISVDTACSSSLVAIHLAMQSLRQGECSLALAGGVSIMCTPGIFAEMNADSAGAPDGRCKSFSADANGAGWSEGAGMLLLERLSDAQRHGHPTLALLRGSAINQDGKSQGLTAPNGPAQERVIRQALANARLAPQDVDAVEAHGTGTTLGDPIEAHALFATYGTAHSLENPLWLGSLKSNLGHTQAAAGVGGVIKMVLAMQHGVLPRTLHAKHPSPHIDWSPGTVRLLNEAVPWKLNGHLRRAGVSSFGISGTNAHVILEEAPPESVPEIETPQLPAWPVLLSAKSEAALRGQAEKLHQHVLSDETLAVPDLAHSLARNRSHFEHRAALVAHDRPELLAGLASLAQGRATAGAVLGRATGKGKVVFVFPGQGSQWGGMALALLDTSPVFREQLEACERALAPHVDWSLLSVLRGDAGIDWLDRVDVVQPALFSVMVSLAALWRSMGLEPDAVIGHSQGEVAAAFVAGALSLEDAAKIVALRSRALTTVTGTGAMASVELGVEALREYLDPWAERLSIAAVNSPQSTLVSGDPEAIDALLGQLSAKQVFARKVRVDYASHCAQVEPVRDELLRQLGALTPRASQRPIYSTVTGATLDGCGLDAGYWYRNLRQTVLFSQTTGKLLDDGYRFFVEISPHPVLNLALHATFASSPRAQEAVVVGSLRRDDGGLPRVFLSLGELHTRGLRLDWSAILPKGRSVPLPTYAFQRERFWLEAPKSAQADVVSAGLSSAEHPLLGASVALADSEGHLFTSRLTLSEHPWLADHAVFGSVIFPGAAFVELALLAAHRLGLERVDELTIETPLALRDGVVLQILVGSPDDGGRRPVSIHSRSQDASHDAPWIRHVSGLLAPVAAQDSFHLRDWPPPHAVALSTEGLYARLTEMGYGYGPGFQGLRSAWALDHEVFAEVQLPESLAKEASRFALHPALLDAALHALLLDADGQDVALPFSWAGVTLHAVGASTLRVRVSRAGDALAIALADANGDPVASIEALSTRPVSSEQLRGAIASLPDALLHVEWTELAAESSESDERWVVLGRDHANLDALLVALEQGAPCPDVLLVPCPTLPVSVAAAHEATASALALVQDWLAQERFADSRLVVLTQRAVATHRDEDVPNLAHAPLWGLLRSAQAEHPHRAITLLDTDDSLSSQQVLRSAVRAAGDHPQVALRQGHVLTPRLARVRPLDSLAVPDGSSWHLGIPTKGSFDGLALLPFPEASAPLVHGQVRVAVRAAGLNFRDVLDSLGMYPGDAGPLGGEGAGVVLEVGPGVSAFAPGDRVMGLLRAAFAPVAVTDHRYLVPIPDGLSFVQAASIPIVFLTAFYGLLDLGRLRPGQRLLVHAAAGGVGMAAVQLARHFGAEVFATASPGKWETLRALGFDDEHLASSRTLDFEGHFLRASGGLGMDVVLDSLAREFVDASLRLLPRGGHFVEMGKTDIRDPGVVATLHPSVVYQAFDLGEAGPDRIQEMLRELLALFERGTLQPVPITAWDIRRAPDAFRALAQARHVGKHVFTLPRPLNPEGTVLVTGGTGTLGALLARHLVRTHHVKHLLLTSRQGPAAPGAASLLRDLQAEGARVSIVACDAADESALRSLLDSVPSDHPLTAVVHAAGSIDDGILADLSPERLHSVLRSKVDSALHLHSLTRHLDLDAFVLFSSLSGVLGSPGQANYCAANTFLDALAHHRRALGLHALSLDWGYWLERSALTSHVSDSDLRRMARAGLRPLSSEDGLALFDAALARCEPALVTAAFDANALRANANALPGMLRGLVRVRSARPTASNTVNASSLQQRLLALSAAEQERTLLDVVRGEIAVVLGVASPGTLEPLRPLQELGLDSLMAVELRNRLVAATGLRLQPTLLFNYPTPKALASFLAAQILGHDGARRVEALPGTTSLGDDAIAIVAMGCRYPGGVRTPEDLWQLVREGRDAISGFPENRGWATDDPGAVGTMQAREGGFLYDADLFDPAFFGISPREALAVDPQQRLLLETTWETFERAGIDPTSLLGSQTGVFVGVIYNDYATRLEPSIASLGELKSYLGLGSSASVASGRIAYTLGLQGPAMSVDTACSSSLVAVHLAAQALRRGECSLALAGGVTVMATPGIFAELGPQHAGSPDGRCKSFSAEANGAGWAEGAGMLLLERLSDAQRNGHPILALLRGSAVNQDGKSQGLTAPNGPAQERVIRQALADASLSPLDIDAVEAHGTGTTLGDPIEVQALLATYGEAHSKDNPLWLGSLKSNLGHAQAAAGVGGIIKMVLALQHGLLPKTLHAERPSPHIDWSPGTVRLLSEPVVWDANGHLRRAAVSSFGISGTNAHVVLEEAPPLPSPPPEGEGAVTAVPVVAGAVTAGAVTAGAVTAVPVPVLLSAKSDVALRAQIERLREHLVRNPELTAVNVAFSLATTRSHFEHRAAFVVTDRDALLDALAKAVTAPSPPGGGLGWGSGKLAVLFTGQGSQRLGMGRALHHAFPVFRDAFDAICSRFDPQVRHVVFSHDERLHLTLFAQTSLFALEVALFRLFESWGLVPDLLLGHSIGELSAAHVAGVLSLDDACALVSARARLMQDLPQVGAMVALQASEDELLPRLSAGAAIAALNGPASTVVSGDEDAVLALAAHFVALGRKSSRLRVSHAFHSHHMDGMLEAFERVARSVTFHPARIPIVSNLSGRLASDTELRSPEYWVRHVRHAVRFLDGVRTLEAEGATTFLELGPHGVLSALGHDALSDEAQARSAFLPALRKDRDDVEALCSSLGALHTRGLHLDWRAFFAPFRPQCVSLPTYAFQRHRFWLEAPSSPRADVASAGQASAEHPLLVAAVPLADSDGFLFTGRLSLPHHPWLAGHAVFGTVILPGTAYVDLALVAAHRVGLDRVEELTLQAPLVLPKTGAVVLQLSVGAPDETGRRSLALHSRLEDAPPDAAWTLHATGLLGPRVESAPFDLRVWPPEGAIALETEGLYERLADAGLAYGPDFQGLHAAWTRGNELFAEVHLPSSCAKDASRFGLHPALLDAALHILAHAPDGGGDVPLPFSWMGISLRTVGASTVRVRLTRIEGESSVSLAIADATGEPVASVETLASRPITAEQLQRGLAVHHDALLRVDWTPLPSPEATSAAHWALVGTDDFHAFHAAVQHGAPVPELVILDFSAPPDTAHVIAAAHDATARALSLLQTWLADDRFASSRLVLLTHRAIATRADEDVPHLPLSPLWGLARSAQSENPDRPIFLLDLDDSEPSRLALPSALASSCNQLALRNGTPLAPRLVRARAEDAQPVRSLDLEGTVLITGGTGVLGARVARHLVHTHGIKHLLLASRQGPTADGAESLQRDLEAAGARVTISACDAADRRALEALLACVPVEHPLTAVVHAAGTLDDGILGSLTHERLHSVLRAKVDAAWNLHELTKDLAAFVLFSSLSGVLGGPGQANYAAANVFLDALAHHRRALGLPALALDWGAWTDTSAMTAHLADADLRRMARAGMRSLATDEALALFDAALRRADPVLVPARFDGAALAARVDALPPMLQGLTRPKASRPRAATAPTASSLQQRLLSLSLQERESALLDLVRSEIASVLALASPQAIERHQPLQELGLDSLMALELRNRLAAACGLRLQPTLFFDHPTPHALALFLRESLASTLGGPKEHGPLERMLQQAFAAGNIDKGWNVISAAAQLRLLVEGSSATANEPPVLLAQGKTEPRLFCFPAFGIPSGPLQFLKFASNFKNRRDVCVLPHTGYRPGQALPASLDDFVAAHAKAVLKRAGNTPFALAGVSAGGYVAHMVAAYLERLGRKPAGVVLLDAYGRESIGNERLHFHLNAGWLDHMSTYGASDTEITAMCWYHEMLSDWRPRRLASPVLLVRASDPFETMEDGKNAADWRSNWEHPHDAVDVPGNHFTMIQQPETAGVVDQWLRSLAPERIHDLTVAR
ncbi:SDR family NAD(P)-dependent oxidoreductase [Pendulispora rubella]|uniref:SDR family NAD(P)-dependent oxidoreductase n=1 Tax=Pendulispora rubella TaxID=2741070 RepID=A0ABZ2KSH0_9BACT